GRLEAATGGRARFILSGRHPGPGERRARVVSDGVASAGGLLRARNGAVPRLLASPTRRLRVTASGFAAPPGRRLRAATRAGSAPRPGAAVGRLVGSPVAPR